MYSLEERTKAVKLYIEADCNESAVMFSMIQTAIENELDPHKYLTWLMKTANGADLSQMDMIHTLLPWKAPTECKAK